MKLKVVDILKCFSKEDLKNFNDYLCSPIFNKRKIIISLFNVYKKFHPDFNEKNLVKGKVFRKIFPGKPYSDEVFRNLNSILLRHIEDFLSFINYCSDPFTVKKHLLSEINSRKIVSSFEKNYQETKKLINMNCEKDMDYFKNEYTLAIQKDIYNSFINKFSKKDISFAQLNLLAFFVMQILEIQNYILYECRILNYDKSLFISDLFIEDFFKKLPEEISQMPQVQIYYNAFKLEQTNKEEFYHKSKSLLKEHGDLIGKEKHYNIYIDMIDFIKRTGSTNEIATVRELFNLRKEIIEKGLFKEDFMTNMFFVNLVQSGVRLKEFEWVINFINNYSPIIIEKYRESSKELALAYLFFEKKDFQESLYHLSNVKYEDNYYNLEIKSLSAKIFFEMNDYESLININNSYKMYLAKNRSINLNTKLSHSNFINSLNKLLKIKELKKFHKLDKLSKEIEKKKIIYKYWIEEKIYELM